MRDADRPIDLVPPRSDDRPSLGIVIASRNRRRRLIETLEAIASLDAPTVVVDDASEDGTSESVRTAHARVSVLTNDRNIGVESYNRGAAHLETDVLLILD
ncbi:MAG: glycosyltransferase family 2 protein, partial [Phycisphaerales bacterium]|nr:glycosyltransferase family 2 protein [Phycisphaerales bacterium]